MSLTAVAAPYRAYLSTTKGVLAGPCEWDGFIPTQFRRDMHLIEHRKVPRASCLDSRSRGAEGLR